MANAAQTLAAQFEAFGLPELASWVIQKYVSDEITDETTMLIELRKTEEYKTRFPAMADLQKKALTGGRGWNEGDYIRQENAYREILSSSGLNPTLWDSADDFAALMRNEISPDEVSRRVEAARQAAVSTDPATREQLNRLYGIGVSDLMGYALVPDRGRDEIQKISTTAILAGMGSDAGIGGGLGREQWENYAGEAIQSNTGYGELRETIEGARTLAVQQSRLAALEGENFTDQDALDIAVKRDSDKALKSQKRAQREKARFSGSSGIASGGLGGSTL